MKKLIILLVVPLFLAFRTGDEIDEKKMNRDIEIAKNILSTLINSSNDSWFGGSSIDGTYIKDYGVVFTIPEHLVYFHNGANVFAIPEVPPIPDIDIDLDYYSDYDFSEEDDITVEKKIKEKDKEFKRQKKEFLKKEQEMQEKMEEFEARQEEFERVREDARVAIAEAHEVDEFHISGNPDNEINWEEIMITFMTDYADLIGQLKPDERIVIKQQSPYRQIRVIWQGEDESKTIEHKETSISAEVLRKDVSAYKAGKIKKDIYVKRIDIKKTEPQKKVADLEMFANIFHRFYSHDLSETLYSQGKPRYEVLDGFGAVFHLKVTSGPAAYTIVKYNDGATKEWGVKPGERKPENRQLFEKFKEDIKAFMLDYGRTIRTLSDNEKVMLDIKINSCRGCEIPGSMEVSIEMSALKQYDQQKLSRDEALSQIVIKEN